MRAGGEGEREGWAAAWRTSRTAKQKVHEKGNNIRHLERSVKRFEEWVAREANVKEQVVDEVVVVEVVDMVEEKVKERVEEKVVERKLTGAGQWLRGFLGDWTAKAIMELPWDPAVLAGPQPPNLDHPLLVAPEPHPPNPRDAFAKALRAIFPALDMEGTVCYVRSSVDLGKRSSVDRAKPPLLWREGR